METALIAYAVCASALLICSTLPIYPARKAGRPNPAGTVDYVVISGFLLLDWEHGCPNLLIFDLHSDRESNWRHKNIPGVLTISLHDFQHLARWLPPGSRVVFCGMGLKRPFDAQTERILLQLGIEAIYLLEGELGLPLLASTKRISSPANK